jgi:hypothetical protein
MKNGSRRRILVLGLLLCLLSQPALAFLTGDAWLAAISSVLQEVATVRMALQDMLQGDILQVYEAAFPGRAGEADGVFKDLGLVARSLRAIRDDVRGLSCGWRFTARTALIRDSLLKPLRFCKPGFQATWGAPSGWMEDAEELHDALGSLGLNVLSFRAEAEDGSWAEIWPVLEGGAEHVRRSPGEASRDEAVGLAGASLMAEENMKLGAIRALVENEDQDLERFVARKEADFAAYVLGDLAQTALPGVDGG